MCGIVGFYGIDRAADASPPLLQRMLSYIAHRGQDEFGYWFDHRCGLGTARLSIIDLKSGQQPFSDASGRYCIAFNGEIFNYIELRQELEGLGCVFTSRSDTEVLLHALIKWDVAALPKLNGQFAFAFYDRRRGRLLMARDPFGERPLFFTRLAKGIVFASEIKGIFALPEVVRGLDSAAIANAYYGWTHLPAETSFAGIQNLPHGHWLEIVDGQVGTPVCYHRLRWDAGPTAINFEQARESLIEKLEQSVRIRLRSDVPVGTYLSGGLDSTIVTYLAQKLSNHQVRSFSVAFEDASFDEARYQNEAARALDTLHTVVSIGSRQIAERFQDVMWHTETVQFRTAPVPLHLLSKAVHDSGIKVVLTGEGADEAFLGYDIFKELFFRLRFQEFKDDKARLEAVLQLYRYMPQFNERNASTLVSFYAQFVKERTAGLFSHETRYANGAHALRLLAAHPEESTITKRITRALSGHYPDFFSHDAIQRAQIMEYDSLLAGYLLSSQGDRMTAAHTIEGRCPFLDTNLVDFANALPTEFRLKDNTNEKFILKEAFKNVIPQSVRERPKQPYRAPGASCFLKAGATWVDDALSSESLRACGIFDAAYAEKFVAKLRAQPGQISPRDDQAFILLLSTVLLHQQFVAGFAEPATDISHRLVRAIDARTDARP